MSQAVTGSPALNELGPRALVRVDAGTASPIPYAIAEIEATKPAGLAITPGRVLRALRRRWLIALPLAIVAAVAAGLLASEFIRADFTVRTQVSVAASQPVYLYETPEGRVDLTTYQKRQAALLRSRPVLQSALEKPGVADLSIVKESSDPIGWLERDLKIDFSVSPEIMRVTLNGPNSSELITLLNAIRETYLENGVNKELTDKKNSLERLRQLAAEERVKADELRLQARHKANSHNVADEAALRTQFQRDQTRLTNLQTRMFQLDVLIKDCEQIRSELSSKAVGPGAPTTARTAEWRAAQESALAKDAEVQACRATVARLEADVFDCEQKAADPATSAKVREKRSELSRAVSALKDRERLVCDQTAKRLRDDTTGDGPPSVTENEMRASELKSQAERARKELASLDIETRSLNLTTMEEARGIAELDRMAGRIGEIEDRIKLAKARSDALELELKAPARAQTLEEAVVAQVPQPQKKLRLMAGAIVVSFLGVLFIVAYLDLRSGRIDSPDGVDQQLGAGIVSCMPRVSSSALRPAIHSHFDESGSDERMICDAADACRTLMVNTSPGGGSKVIMVTSAAEGEGKTTFAAQLALSLGRAGHRTLLVDGDVRQPGVHAAFGRSVGPGLADALRNPVPAPNVVQSGPVPNLEFVSAGRCDPAEAVALLHYRLGKLIDEWKPQYEVILIDTPPLLNLPDAMVIGRHADGTILSLMNEVSTMQSAQAACSRLRTLSLPVLGVVLNAARVRTPRGY